MEMKRWDWRSELWGRILFMDISQVLWLAWVKVMNWMKHGRYLYYEAQIAVKGS